MYREPLFASDCFDQSFSNDFNNDSSSSQVVFQSSHDFSINPNDTSIISNDIPWSKSYNCKITIY